MVKLDISKGGAHVTQLSLDYNLPRRTVVILLFVTKYGSASTSKMFCEYSDSSLAGDSFEKSRK